VFIFSYQIDLKKGGEVFYNGNKKGPFRPRVCRGRRSGA
jgi:hypothetical protein